MILKPVERLPSEAMGQSLPSNTNSKIIHCVIRSDSPDRGSLYVSGMKGIEKIDNIKLLNVKSILTCSQGCKLNYTSDDIPNYKYLPFPQDSIFSPNEYFRTVSSFIKESLEKQNCIVHCENGGNKSISVVISYLMKYQNLTFNEGLSYIKKKLKQIDLNPKYQQALKQFEKHLKTNNQTFNNSRQLNNSKLSSQKSSKSKKLNQSMDSKLDLNPQDMDIKSNKFDTSRRYKTSKTYINDQEIELGQKQTKSKIKTEYPSNVKNQTKKSNQKYLTHKDPIHFDQIYSSSHVQYIGVKRQPKNSKSCFKKQKQNLVNFSPQSQSFQIYQPHDKIDYLTVQKDLNKSRFSSRINSKADQKLKTQRSQRQSQNKSAISIRNEREKTKRTQQIENNKSLINVSNQQQLSKSRVSCMSRSSNHQRRNKNLSKSQSKIIENQLDVSQIMGRQFKLSPSKREQFEKVNQQLNTCINQITTSYETEMTNLRVNYHNRLRHLRPSRKQTQQSQLFNVKV